MRVGIYVLYSYRSTKICIGESVSWFYSVYDARLITSLCLLQVLSPFLDVLSCGRLPAFSEDDLLIFWRICTWIDDWRLLSLYMAIAARSIFKWPANDIWFIVDWTVRRDSATYYGTCAQTVVYWMSFTRSGEIILWKLRPVKFVS